MWKDVLLPGEVALTKGSARFDAADIRNAADVCNAKLAYGWRIPLCWEHHDEALPVRLSAGEKMVDRLASLAKNVAGEVRAFREQGGRLQFLPDVYDTADIPRLNNAKFVSPQVRRNWKDSDGNVWEGLTIQHVAATPIPKQKMQDAFQLSAGADGPLRIAEEELIRLSEASVKKPNAELEALIVKLKGVPATVKLANRLAKLNLSEADDDGEPVDDGTGSTAEFKSLVEALNGTGKLTIPDEVTNISELIIAIKASSGDKGDELDLDDDQLPPNTKEAEATPPMTLSNAAAVAKMPAVQRKALESADKMMRTDIGRRIKRLVKSGRITPAIAAPLAANVGKVNLSFADDGDLLPNSLVNRIEAYEALPANASWAKHGAAVNLGNADVREGAPIYSPDRTADESPAANKKRQEAFEQTLKRE